MKISNITLPNTGLVLVLGDAGAGKSSRVANALQLEGANTGQIVQVLDVTDLNLAGNNPRGFNVLELGASSEAALIVILAETLAPMPPAFKAHLQENCRAVFVLHSSSQETRNWITGRPYRKLGFIRSQMDDPATFPIAGAGKNAVAAVFVRTTTGTNMCQERIWDIAAMCNLPLVRDERVASFANVIEVCT